MLVVNDQASPSFPEMAIGCFLYDYARAFYRYVLLTAPGNLVQKVQNRIDVRCRDRIILDTTIGELPTDFIDVRV